MDSSVPPSATLAEVVEDFLASHRRGEQPTADAYAERFPDLAADILATLPALAALEELDPHGESEDGPVDEGPQIDQIGDYRILGEIGRGGMGVVYEAQQLSLGRRVALKVLPFSASGDKKSQLRFQREARAVARLHHTNIVPVFEVGQEDNRFYYAMQLIHGWNLATVIDDLKRLRAESKSVRNGKRASLPTAGGPQDATPGNVDHRQRSSDASSGWRAGQPAAADLAQTLVSGRFRIEAADAPRGRPAGDRRAVEDGESEASAATPHETDAQGSSSRVANLPGQTERSTTDGGQRHYYLSIAQVGRQVAEALGHAHARGVIHRDIKPSNLLLDASGVVWVTDFGLAKTDAEDVTHTGDLLGTLRYMSPERFKGHCDARADVYSLGLTLYELLVLRPAFDSPDRLQLVEHITRIEPEAPRAIDPRIPRDLETIVLKAIDHEPRHRYQTAQAMLDDLRRFINDEPVRARRIAWHEHLWRWSRRNKGLAASLLVVIGLLLVLSLGSLSAAAIWYRQETRQRRLASANERLAADRLAALQRESKLLQRETSLRREAQDANLLAESRGEALRQSLYAAEMNLACQSARLQDGIPVVKALVDNWKAPAGQMDPRGWEWFYLKSLCHRDQLTMRGDSSGVVGCDWSPDGRFLACSTWNGSLEVWDAHRGELVHRDLDRHRVSSRAVAWSPDGTRIATAAVDGTIVITDAVSGKQLASMAGQDAISDLAWSPDGTQLATDGVTQVWGADGRKLRTYGSKTTCIAWSPDGKSLVGGQVDGEVIWWDVLDRVRPRVWKTGSTRRNSRVCYRPDGRLLAVGSAGGKITLWKIPDALSPGKPRLQRTLTASLGSLTSLDWHPGGECLVSAGDDRAVDTWCLTQSEPGKLETLRGHQHTINQACWSPDGRRIASVSEDGTARIWIPKTPAERRDSLPGSRGLSGAAWHPQGVRLACIQGNEIKVWDTVRSVPMMTLTGHRRGIRQVRWSPDGQRLATASRDGTANIWTLAGDHELTLRGQGGELRTVAWSPDGSQLATAGQEKTICIWNAATGELQVTMEGHRSGIVDLRWHPFDGRLASCSSDHTIKIWDPIEGLARKTLAGHEGFVTAIAWDAAGKRLASCSHDQSVRLWDVERGVVAQIFKGHLRQVESLCWNATSSRLASLSRDGHLILWDPGLGQKVCTLHGPRGDDVRIAWSPDGTRLVGVSRDDALVLWDATLGFAHSGSKIGLQALQLRLEADPSRLDDWRLAARHFQRSGKLTGARQSHQRIIELLEARRDAERENAAVVGELAAALAAGRRSWRRLALAVQTQDRPPAGRSTSASADGGSADEQVEFVYSLPPKSRLKRITALRLQLLPPGRRTGTADPRNDHAFVPLTGLGLSLRGMPPGAAPVPLSWRRAAASVAAPDVEKIVMIPARNLSSRIRWEKMDQTREAVFELDPPLQVAAGTSLQVDLAGAGILASLADGKPIRVSVTGEPHAASFQLPAMLTLDDPFAVLAATYALRGEVDQAVDGYAIALHRCRTRAACRRVARQAEQFAEVYSQLGRRMVASTDQSGSGMRFAKLPLPLFSIPEGSASW